MPRTDLLLLLLATVLLFAGGVAWADGPASVEGVSVGGAVISLKDMTWPGAFVVVSIVLGRLKPTLRIEHHLSGDAELLKRMVGRDEERG